MTKKTTKLYNEAIDKIKNEHIGCFKGMEQPLFLISNQYPGLWLEHVYDSIMMARLESDHLYLAENAIHLFIDGQRDNGQLPFAVMDGNKCDISKEQTMRYSQIQECVSFFSLALEVYEMNKEHSFLEKIYEAGKKWDKWLRDNRMTTRKGLVEMFVGYDTGHDNSGRLKGMSCERNYCLNGVIQDADKCPMNDEAAPILAVDMNCNFYANEIALSKMAEYLGKNDEAEKWRCSAAEIKYKLFEYCYDEADAFFYDVDKNGNKRRFKSSTIFHLFLEKVLERDTDREIIERIYREHIKNPNEFWTPYPFPSMAINDPSAEGHADFNCWGYYTQGLIVLRCSRWMDDYGYSDDYDHVLKKWVDAWTEHYESIKFAQEIDPVTGIPTKSSEWYSSCMLAYIYAVRRLGLLK